MIAMTGLFEAHLTVSDLQRSMDFYEGVLGLQRAHLVPEREAAFYWIGGAGHAMLGLWGAGAGPQRMSLHVAFAASVADVLAAPAQLEAAGVVSRDFWGEPSKEPVVLGWMPAVAVYFTDPDGHLLEFLAMLPETARADLGIVTWNQWRTEIAGSAAQTAST
jgi:catechol 2,3-dioxygenase-like lactoylglutathione lyase family enzyme